MLPKVVCRSPFHGIWFLWSVFFDVITFFPFAPPPPDWIFLFPPGAVIRSYFNWFPPCGLFFSIRDPGPPPPSCLTTLRIFVFLGATLPCNSSLEGILFYGLIPLPPLPPAPPYYVSIDHYPLFFLYLRYPRVAGLFFTFFFHLHFSHLNSSFVLINLFFFCQSAEDFQHKVAFLKGWLPVTLYFFPYPLFFVFE